VSGGLTEGQLADEFGLREPLHVPLKSGSATIAWWKDRQDDVDKKLEERSQAEQ